MDGRQFKPHKMKLNLTLMKGCFALLIGFTVVNVSGQEQCGNAFDSNQNGTVDIEDFLGILDFSEDFWDSKDFF